MSISSFAGYIGTELFRKPAIDDNLINKRVRLFLHQMITLTSLQNGCLITFIKMQKQPPEVYYEKAVLKNFAIFTGKRLCWSLFSIHNIVNNFRAPILKITCNGCFWKCSWNQWLWWNLETLKLLIRDFNST